MNRANIRIGTHRGLCFTACGMGGVYREDADTPASLRSGAPGRVPFGVVRPLVFRFGGATAQV